MTLLKRATIKSYDAGSHRAAVGISGSLSVWLDSIAISDGIAAASVVAGRECAVLFHEDDNPDDAVIVSVHGGGPPSSGASDEIIDADGDTKVQVEESSDEDIIRFDTAGAERMTIDAAGIWKVAKAGGHAIGGVGLSNTNLRLSGSLTPAAGNVASVVELVAQFTQTADGLVGYGLTGNATGILAVYHIAKLAGLSFRAIVAGGAGAKTATDVIGTESLPGMFGASAKTITDMSAFKSGVGFATVTNSTITRWNEFWAAYAGNTAVATHTGLRVTDITAGTNKYLIWAGPNAPSATGVTNLRLDAGNPPNAGIAAQGDSQLYLTFNENGVLAMRHVRHKTFATLAAGDKVMIAV